MSLARCTLTLALIFFCIFLTAGADAASPLPRYRVVDLPSLSTAGSSEGNSINQIGLISGSSTTSGGVTHAAAWLLGAPYDLKTLGGTSSAVLWPVKNDLGLIAGISQTNQPETLGEAWSCGAFIGNDGHTCHGFAWFLGEMHEMPTFGGENSFATGANNFGQVVGWAENTVRDPSCDGNDGSGGNQVLQFRAALWQPATKQMQQLGPLPGDSTSAATAINDAGMVAGISGNCGAAVGSTSAAHMVIWQNGRIVHQIPYGATDAWNTPMAINQHGDVAGFVGDPNPNGFVLAFVWNVGGASITHLGTLTPADDSSYSEALGINNHGQVVGISVSSTLSLGSRGFLYQDGQLLNLQDLVSDYPGIIVDAQDINDLGEITGQAVVNGAAVSFLAVPVRK
jgi:probable HAF family extracellular repeat protein